MTHRDIPHPPHCPSLLKLMVLLCGAMMISLALLASQYAQVHANQEPPVPSPTPLTEQQRLSQVIAHLAALGEQLPPESPDHRVAMRRETYQQVLCQLAYHLSRTEDPAFAPMVAEACDAQWAWWPEQAQFCFPCQR